MGAYTEEDVFRDCSRDRKQHTRSEERVYKAIWLALCRWIVERFDRGRGVDLPTVMQLTWVPDLAEGEALSSAGEVGVAKPVWRMAAGFEKAHGLGCRYKADHRKQEDSLFFAKSEELNFHKIATKYSNNKLSKDQCFSGLRDMFSRIGKVMFEGKDVKLFFGVGDLCAHDRKVHFAFDGHYHRFIRRATATPQTAMSQQAFEGPVGGSRQQSRQSDRLVIDHGDGGDSENQNPAENSPIKEFDDMCTRSMSRPSTSMSRPSTSGSINVSASAFFQGVPIDESWKTKKIRQRVQRIRQQNEKLWALRDKELAKTVDFETRNMLLGEQRRVAGELNEEERLAEEKRRRYEFSKAQRDELLRKEQQKKNRRLQLRNEKDEDPFFVHLEPDEKLVDTKKKKAQGLFRSGLEEQIANRLKTANSEKARILHMEQDTLENGTKLLRQTLIKDEIQKQKKDMLLKGDWAQQINGKEKEKLYDATINRCLTEKIKLPFQEDAVRRPSTSMSLQRSAPPSRASRVPSRMSSAARMSLSRAGR